MVDDSESDVLSILTATTEALVDGGVVAQLEFFPKMSHVSGVPVGMIRIIGVPHSSGCAIVYVHNGCYRVLFKHNSCDIELADPGAVNRLVGLLKQHQTKDLDGG